MRKWFGVNHFDLFVVVNHHLLHRFRELSAGLRRDAGFVASLDPVRLRMMIERLTWSSVESSSSGAYSG